MVSRESALGLDRNRVGGKTLNNSETVGAMKKRGGFEHISA